LLEPAIIASMPLPENELRGVAASAASRAEYSKLILITQNYAHLDPRA